MEKIGRYQIVGELGRGAMGVVYRAVDPNIGRTVALKTMRLDVEGIERDELLARFRNEARAAGLMNHPNIVTVHDADEVEGLFYMAMEYLEGETLQTFMTPARVIPGDEIVEIAKQVAAGLDYAHSMNVVHRDIKPANIMITRQNVAKIMDFGISKAVGTMTRTGQVLGTPYYMSPEQVMGIKLDGRSDFFSFGVVLYEMATGQRPFSGENVTTIIYKIVNEDPAPPSELQLALHPGLNAVILRCLAKKPNDRYQTGAELAREISNFRSLAAMDELPTSMVPRSNLSKTATQATSTQTNRAQIATQAVAVQTAAATVSAMVTRAPKQPAPAVQPTVIGKANKTSRKTSAIVAAIMVFVLLYLARHRPTPKMQPRAAAQDHYGTKPEPAASRSTTPLLQTAESESAKPENKAVVTPISGAPITATGASIKTRRVELGPKNPPYRVDPAPVATAVSVTSEPPGASIEIDGADTGKITPAQIPVSEGKHTVVLHMSGYQSAEAKAEIARGQIYSLPQRLSPMAVEQPVATTAAAAAPGNTLQASIPNGKGLIDFVTNPPGANIFIEGRRANAATPAHNAFPPGDYDIELRMQGYKSVQRTVHVDAGQISRVQENLAPQ